MRRLDFLGFTILNVVAEFYLCVPLVLSSGSWWSDWLEYRIYCKREILDHEAVDHYANYKMP